MRLHYWTYFAVFLECTLKTVINRIEYQLIRVRIEGGQELSHTQRLITVLSSSAAYVTAPEKMPAIWNLRSKTIKIYRAHISNFATNQRRVLCKTFSIVWRHNSFLLRWKFKTWFIQNTLSAMKKNASRPMSPGPCIARVCYTSPTGI